MMVVICTIITCVRKRKTVNELNNTLIVTITYNHHVRQCYHNRQAISQKRRANRRNLLSRTSIALAASRRKHHRKPKLYHHPRATAHLQAVPKRQAEPIGTDLTKKDVARKVVKSSSSPSVEKPTGASPTYKGAEHTRTYHKTVRDEIRNLLTDFKLSDKFTHQHFMLYVAMQIRL